MIGFWVWGRQCTDFILLRSQGRAHCRVHLSVSKSTKLSTDPKEAVSSSGENLQLLRSRAHSHASLRSWLPDGRGHWAGTCCTRPPLRADSRRGTPSAELQIRHHRRWGLLKDNQPCVSHCRLRWRGLHTAEQLGTLLGREWLLQSGKGQKCLRIFNGNSVCSSLIAESQNISRCQYYKINEKSFNFCLRH